jgi:hypothetical protein
VWRTTANVVVVAGAIAAAGLGCDKRKATPASAPPDAAPAAASVAVPAALPLSELDASPDAPEPDDGDDYLAAAAKSGKSIGHTSLVLKVTLANGKTAAFKPHSKPGPGRYKGEIAARRLAEALDLPNVPRAFFRTFSEAELASALGAGTPSRAAFDRDVIASAGVVRGAIIPWIERFELLALEKEPWWSRWRMWLKKGALITNDRASELGPDGYLGVDANSVARDASNLVVFDWLTANFDRWSGGNVGWDRRNKRVLFVDNDGAFLDHPPAEALARNKRLLENVDRFSRALVTRLRAMSDDDLRAAIGEETKGTALLSPAILAGVVGRKKELLALVDAKIAANGDKDTLYFP